MRRFVISNAATTPIAAGDPRSARSSMERHLTLTRELFEELPERVFVAPRA